MKLARTFLLAGALIVAVTNFGMGAPEGLGRADQHNPTRQIRTPTGETRHSQGHETDAEVALRMWRNVMGNQPIPDHIRKKYNIAPEVR